jgi:hypothetical protein
MLFAPVGGADVKVISAVPEVVLAAIVYAEKGS